jgi:dynein heavy chain, axonemal
MDGTCEFCKPGKGPNDEMVQKYTFETDIDQNNIIIKLKFLLNMGIKKANDRARRFKEMFEPDPETKDADKDNPMWDPKLKLAVEKLKDKNPPTSLKYLESKMGNYKNKREVYRNMPKEKISFFFSMTFTSVISTFKNQADSWVERYGTVLREIAFRDLEATKKVIEDYDNSLSENPANIEELKSLLNKISEIKTTSMMMEFRIADIVEKFRTLINYKQQVDHALVD